MPDHSSSEHIECDLALFEQEGTAHRLCLCSHLTSKITCRVHSLEGQESTLCLHLLGYSSLRMSRNNMEMVQNLWKSSSIPATGSGGFAPAYQGTQIGPPEA